PSAHRVAVGGDGRAICHFGRRTLLERLLVQMPLLSSVDERGAQAENVKAELPHRTIAAGRLHAEVLARYLPHGALGGRQHRVDSLGECVGAQLLTLLVRNSDQLCESLRVPAMDRAAAEDGRRNARDTEGLEVTPSFRLGLHVEAIELHSP